MTPTPRLSVQDLALGYHGAAFAQVSLDLDPAEILALVGPSGCGKSTLLSTIAGIMPSLGGKVVVDGSDISAEPAHLRRIGMVFQDPLLFPHMSVVDNVAYGLRRSGMSRRDARARAEELLTWVDLSGLGTRRPDQLSGGQAQRVALARALAPSPTVLLLDEPFSALDTALRTRLAGDVAALLRERGVAAIHVTHDQAEAEAVGDTVREFAELAVTL